MRLFGKSGTIGVVPIDVAGWMEDADEGRAVVAAAVEDELETIG